VVQDTGYSEDYAIYAIYANNIEYYKALLKVILTKKYVFINV